MAFRDASHWRVGPNAQFNEAQSITNITQYASEDPLAILQKHCAFEATHESSTAAYAPKCKPGTRTEVIRDIANWTTNTNRENHILWFSGPAGGGKTVIQREVARRAQEEGRLAASYFFSTRIPGLDHETPFVATIVYQLIGSIPELRPLVAEVVQNDPAIFKKSLDHQLKHLVLNIFLHLQHVQRPLPNLIVIDGLDECRDPNQRKNLLKLLRSLIDNSSFRFRIVIASRPELDIRTEFGMAPLETLTFRVRLEDYDGSGDIRNYLCDEFARIRDCHPSKNYIPSDWPSEDILETLVSKSSSQFIFPSTVIKYVDNQRQNPVVLLQRVLQYSGSAQSENPFADIDALYHLVLHPSSSDTLLIRRLLHAIMVMSEPPTNQVSHQAFLDAFFGLQPGQTDIALCDLHSVLSIETERSWLRKDYTPIRFHHRSLQDYLSSRYRSGDMFQSQLHTFLDLAELCVWRLQEWAPGDEPELNVKAAIDHSAYFWARYTAELAELAESHIGSLTLLNFQPLSVIQWGFLKSGIKFFSDKSLAPSLAGTQDKLHYSQCGIRQCIPLCQRLRHITENWHSAPSLLRFRSFPGPTFSERLELLPQVEQIFRLPAEYNTGTFREELSPQPLQERVGDPSIAYTTPGIVIRPSFWRRITCRA